MVSFIIASILILKSSFGRFFGKINYMKNKGGHKRDIELLFEIGCMRYMPRTWKRFFNPDVANNTEHTLRVIWIAFLISKYEGGDEGKIIKMALAHDLPESRTGDVDYLSRQYTERKEEKATDDILKDTVFEKELTALWREYEKRKSIEAKIVKDADNIDVELELVEQKSRGHSIGGIWGNNRKKLVYPKLYTKTAKELFNEIHKANIHDWHLNANNRFKGGDWKKIKK
jgi:putative hydrolases of HD superfamily